MVFGHFHCMLDLSPPPPHGSVPDDAASTKDAARYVATGLPPSSGYLSWRGDPVKSVNFNQWLNQSEHVTDHRNRQKPPGLSANQIPSASVDFYQSRNHVFKWRNATPLASLMFAHLEDKYPDVHFTLMIT